MNYQPYSFQPEEMLYRQQQLLKDIEKAVNDEFQAVQFYTRLAELAPHQNDRTTILAVRQDEIKHFYRFSNDYFELSGQYPQISLQVPLPGNYRSGVQESIKEEQDTVPFYQSIASQITNPRIKGHFLRAANDEQRHAQIFSQIASGF